MVSEVGVELSWVAVGLVVWAGVWFDALGVKGVRRVNVGVSKGARVAKREGSSGLAMQEMERQELNTRSGPPLWHDVPIVLGTVAQNPQHEACCSCMDSVHAVPRTKSTRTITGLRPARAKPTSSRRKVRACNACPASGLIIAAQDGDKLSCKPFSKRSTAKREPVSPGPVARTSAT